MPDYETKIRREEGEKLQMYKCSEGKWTIGVGYNIEDNGISQAVSNLMLKERLEIAISDAKTIIPNFYDLSEVRKIALVDMSFQMGKGRLSGFKNMIQAIEIGAWNVAAIEMLDSRYAQQTPNRANRNASLMKVG